MSTLNRALAVVLLLVGGWAAISSATASAQGAISRKVKNKVTPNYPELARKMNLSGVVKVQVTVAANGVVKDAKLVGGHPVLAPAALDAARMWRFEPGPEANTILEFRFDPNQ